MGTGHDIAMGLRSAYWAMHRRTEACCAECGVTANQFVILAVLSEEDGITQKHLGQRASSDANTIRAMLVLLEHRGLITRKRHPGDGRARKVALTQKGRQVYESLWTKSEGIRQQFLAVLEPEQSEAMVKSLRLIYEEMVRNNGRPGG